jgi:hypothetical protein
MFYDFIVIVLFVVGALIYPIPWVTAWFRGHRNISSIAALNILLGWSFLGWAIALVWALSDNTITDNAESNQKSH